MRAGDFVGAKIYRKPTEDKRTKKDGTPRSPKKLGKIHFPVFTPGGTRVVGFMVRQSDIAGMIERPDRFVALDAIGVYEGAIAVDDVKDTYDAAAAKRLDINLDDCIIWVGMDVRTESGDVVGYCSDVEFKPRSGIVQAFYVTAGAASSVLVGDTQVSPTMLRGYENGAMVVSDEVKSLGYSGGAAAKAPRPASWWATRSKRVPRCSTTRGRLPWTRAVAHWASSSARRAACSRPLRTNTKRRAEARQKLQNSDVPNDGRQAGDLLLRLAVFMGEAHAPKRIQLKRAFGCASDGAPRSGAAAQRSAQASP